MMDNDDLKFVGIVFVVHLILAFVDLGGGLFGISPLGYIISFLMFSFLYYVIMQ